MSGSAVPRLGVRATWWYTVAGVVLLDVMVVGYWLLWLMRMPASQAHPVAPALAVLGAVFQVGATVLLVRDYPATRHRPSAIVLVFGAVGAVLLGAVTRSWMLPVGLIAVLLCLLPWPRGVRWRLTVLLTATLVGLWVIDRRVLLTEPTVHLGLAYASPTLLLVLPALCAFSLWWWDIVRALDEARETAGALSATRERLRLAGEVHDLQGHHLQVIALQLELAERLLDRDPAAAAQQIRTARESVDAARVGTRDLATRFRGVPLPDEIANAADLLRASGHQVDVTLDSDAHSAPAEVLGPLVRESVTNVLKHGAGERATISLRHDHGSWIYTISNDRPATDPGTDGSGLHDIRDRIAALGGTVRTDTDPDFTLTVEVPA